MKRAKPIYLEVQDNRPLTFKEFSEFSRKTAAIVLIALLALGSPVVINAEWVDKIIDVSLAAEYDDNVNRSFFSSVEKDDMLVVPSASIGRVYQLANFTRLAATVDLRGGLYNELDFLNNIFAGATLSMNHKLGVGPLKPWLKVHGSGGYLKVDDDLRDSWLFDSGITVGKRLTNRIDIAAGYAYDRRESGDGDAVPGTNLPSTVFDEDGHSGSILSNVLLTNDLLLSLGYSFRHGDIVSTCDAKIVGMVLDKVDAVTFDKAFEEAFNISPSCAYRIRGNTHDFSVATVYAFSGHTSLNLTYHRVEGDASGLNYSNNRVDVSVNHGF